MSKVLSDLEIAQQASMQPITAIASRIGIDTDVLEQYGHYKAKLPLDLIDEGARSGPVAVITRAAVNRNAVGRAADANRHDASRDSATADASGSSHNRRKHHAAPANAPDGRRREHGCAICSAIDR